jgi:hypothetical protein
MRRLPPGSAFSGFTAGWLHGLDVKPCDPIEVTVPDGAGVSARSGVAVRRSTLGKDDVMTIRNLPATSMVQAVGELCGRLSLIEALVIADAALHDRRVRLDHMIRWAESHAGSRGITESPTGASARRTGIRIANGVTTSDDPRRRRLAQARGAGVHPRSVGQIPWPSGPVLPGPETWDRVRRRHASRHHGRRQSPPEPPTSQRSAIAPVYSWRCARQPRRDRRPGWGTAQGATDRLLHRRRSRVISRRIPGDCRRSRVTTGVALTGTGLAPVWRRRPATPPARTPPCACRAFARAWS